MDSGIGALVQGLVGDVEMTTASGAPTDMGMGVGSLMAAGAQEAPAPQNFRQGGEVAHLQKGSNMTATAPALSFNPLDFASESVMSFGDTVKGRYEDLLPLCTKKYWARTKNQRMPPKRKCFLTLRKADCS